MLLSIFNYTLFSFLKLLFYGLLESDMFMSGYMSAHSNRLGVRLPYFFYLHRLKPSIQVGQLFTLGS